MARRQKLGSADVAWLRMESATNPMTIVGLLVFDRPMRARELKRLIEDRFLVFQRFRQCVTGLDGTPAWEDDPHFDLDAHVHRAALPAPGGQEALQELVSDLMSTPLDFSKPPWQFHLVEDYDGGSALIARLHHCIGDGIALIHVLISLADEYFEGRPVPGYGETAGTEGLIDGLLKPVGKVVTTVGRAAGGLVTGGLGLVRNPGQVLEWTKQGMSVAAATSRILLLSTDSETRFKGEVGVIKRAAWSQPLPLADVKAIGRGAGAKLNDVLLGGLTGALRRYLLAHGEPVEGVEVGTVIPVNLRPMERAFELGNQFGLVFLSLPVGLAEAAERLRAVTQRMDLIKASAEPAVVFAILQAIGSGPEVLHQQVVDIFSSRVSGVVTNVPGPRERLHLGGRAIRRVMFWVPRAGDIGLGVSIISYADEVLVGVGTDARMAPDPEAIVAGFHEELEALRTEFAGAPSPGRRVKR